MIVGVGKSICQTVLLFYGLSVHPFKCNYTVLCMFQSECLSTGLSIVYVSLRPCVRPSACMHIFVILFNYSIGLYVFFSFIRPSDSPSVLSSSISMNAYLQVCCLYTCP